MKYILINDKPVAEPDVIKWADWYDSADRVVAKADIGDVSISTVFLGIDHSFGYGSPILYETMIFGGDHDGFQQRHETKEQALIGHGSALGLVKNGLSLAKLE